jgi:hypothetical protein
LQKSFCTGDQKFSGRRRDFRVKMGGTSSPSEKLTGDFANGLGAILIGELSLASFLEKNRRLVFWDFCNKICHNRTHALQHHAGGLFGTRA